MLRWNEDVSTLIAVCIALLCTRLQAGSNADETETSMRWSSTASHQRPSTQLWPQIKSFFSLIFGREDGCCLMVLPQAFYDAGGELVGHHGLFHSQARTIRDGTFFLARFSIKFRLVVSGRCSQTRRAALYKNSGAGTKSARDQNYRNAMAAVIQGLIVPILPVS